MFAWDEQCFFLVPRSVSVPTDVVQSDAVLAFSLTDHMRGVPLAQPHPCHQVQWQNRHPSRLPFQSFFGLSVGPTSASLQFYELMEVAKTSVLAHQIDNNLAPANGAHFDYSLRASGGRVLGQITTDTTATPACTGGRHEWHVVIS